MHSSDLDYAFSDENLPEGFPELDWQEFTVGEWVAAKNPSSTALRQYLAGIVRFFRADVFKAPASQRRDGLRHIRETHRLHLCEYKELESRIARIRKTMLPGWELWCARTKGGVQ